MKDTEYIQSVKQYTSSLYRFVYSCYPDVSVAEEVVKETFAKLWINSERVDFIKAKIWLFTEVFRQLSDKIKKVHKHTLSSDDFVFEQKLENPADLFVTEANFLSLSLRQKALLLLKDVEDFDYQEMADILWVDLRAVKIGLLRARRNRKEFAEDKKV